MVKWSACSPSTLPIWVRILLTPTVFLWQIVVGKNENKKRGRGWPIYKNERNKIKDQSSKNKIRWKERANFWLAIVESQFRGWIRSWNWTSTTTTTLKSWLRLGPTSGWWWVSTFQWQIREWRSAQIGTKRIRRTNPVEQLLAALANYYLPHGAL